MNDKENTLFLRKFSAMKIKVDKKSDGFDPQSKIVLVDSDQLRKKMRKMRLFVIYLHNNS